MKLPLDFVIPDGWTAVDPGDSGAVFVAVHPVAGEEFTPNITVSVQQRPDDTPMAAIAAEAVERLARTLAGLDVLSRRDVGDPAVPGVMQLLCLRTGEGTELIQTQVHLTVPGPAPEDRLVLELACTAAPATARRLSPGFQRFVAGVHVRQHEGTPQ
ncbi:hypothetical protein Q5425_27120 [Amycolatopsis sp. A133]|uniref:hypothetical protein n=1 Tax=Amycolatopsis sp. A133 TaxID=3064472 RepID=UPI0027F41586|nr:hypothetical protein [Amycolatopsis sp. A133]MDQ7807425.1 hypothetical protein [Amycolatopsis sp. A133]